MSNPEAVNKLVRNLEELANEADGKTIAGSAYGLNNLSGGLLTGGSRRKKGRKRVVKPGSHASKVKTYMKKHKNSTLGQASHAVAQGKK